MARKKNGTPKPVETTAAESAENYEYCQRIETSIQEQLRAKIEDGTATTQEAQVFECFQQMRTELSEYQAENAHATDEIVNLERARSEYEKKYRDVLKLLKEVIEAGCNLSKETISIQERCSVYQNEAFGTSSENARHVGRKDDSFTDADRLEFVAEDDVSNTLTPKARECIDVFEKSRITYLGMTVDTKERIPVMEKLVEQGELIVTAEENEKEAKLEREFDSALAGSLDGDSFTGQYAEYDEAISKLAGQHLESKSSKTVSGNDDEAQFHKEWIRRQSGDRQKLLGGLDFQRIMYDSEGNEVECKKENVIVPNVEGMVARFVGFRESYSEVEIIPMKAYVKHVMTPVFKYSTSDPNTNTKELQRKVQNQLGDGYVVDGIQRERKAERDASNAEKRSQLPENPWLKKNEDAKQKRQAKSATKKESITGQEAAVVDRDSAGGFQTQAPATEANPVQTCNAPRAKSKRTDVFVKQATPGKLRLNSYAGPTLLAFVIFLKFTLNMPINRAVNAGIFAGAGLDVSVGVVVNWINMIYFTKFFYLVPLIRAALLLQKYIHADETPLQVMREPGRDNTKMSYLWLYSSIAGCPHQVRFYDYAPGRSGSYAANALTGWIGTFLITDAYQGYNAVKDCVHCFCMIHARRKFFSASITSSARANRGKAARVVRLFDILFAIEAKLQDCSPEERLDRRKSLMEEPLMQLKELIAAYLKDETIAQSSRLHNACDYFTKYQNQLLRFMTDGNIPLHNMVAENAMRPIAVGRHSWLFAGSPLGGQVIAGMMTIVETAKANGLDPFLYIKFVLEHTRNSDFMLDENLMNSLLPWSQEAQVACKQISKLMPLVDAAC